MNSAKIRIKVGSMELEYEGDPAFLTGGIEDLLTTMGELSTKVPVENSNENSSSKLDAIKPNFDSGHDFSTNTLAAHLSAQTGPELAVCALAQLEFVQKNTSSSRSDILKEMKNATTYYNESMGSNLTRTLATLTKNKRINLISKDTYALNASERKQLETKIAAIE
ncbi:hypothetical protein [uncultured Ruegeria sp.]|uniref:hypothetical protein n=1 Tax=uncultured Ruegeria sp. TaxID=259304 RepID=UPI0026131DCD|nr:hypothetical protein [uncultured Ruegeria sp.]